MSPSSCCRLLRFLFYISYSNNFSCYFPVAYAPVRDWLGAGKDAPFYMKFLAGAITGGVGSVVGNPFDVLKVRRNVYCYYSLMY